MKRFIFFLTITMFSFCAMAQNKPNSSELGFARHFAERSLISMGANPNRLLLKLEEYTDRLLFFNDIRNDVYILMVRDQYASYLHGQILAFSIGTPHTEARKNSTFMTLYNYYDKLIKEMHEGKIPKECESDVPQIGVSPMLYTIRWGQFHMNNVYEGQTESVVSGCGAVAVGQLMKFYEWPTVVKGNFSYQDSNKKLLSMKMDNKVISWGNIKNLYRPYDRDSVVLEPLNKMIALSLMSEFGHKATGSRSRLMKRAMTTHFGYSPQMHLVENEDVSEDTLISLIRHEINEGRPCILSGGDHFFVCDGASNDFLHLNMGWFGSYDGWYRFPVVRKEINPESFIESALINIVPDGQIEKEKTVTVETPGTLATHFSEDECETVTSLIVKGEINGADIQLIRRMAGAVPVSQLFSWKGKLTNLDLSEATFAQDTIPYNIVDAVKDGYSMSFDGVQYDFSQMTKEKWKMCLDNKANECDHYKIVYSDSTYLIKTKTNSDWVGYYMFSDCVNLRTIKLPENIIFIGFCAFNNCHCLKEITIPSGVARVDPLCFSDCFSLERINLCSDSPLLSMLQNENKEISTRFIRNNNPDLRIETDQTLETYANVRARIEEERRLKYQQKLSASKARTVSQAQTNKPKQKVTQFKMPKKGDSVKLPLTGDLSVPPGYNKIVTTYKRVNGKEVPVERRAVKE